MKISSDRNRIVFLTRATSAAVLSKSHAVTAFVEPMEQLKPALMAGVKKVKTAYVNRRRKIEVRDDLAEALIRCVRDFWEVLRRRNARLKLPASLLEDYHLPTDGLPRNTEHHAWAILARELLEGEARSVEAGYPAMVNPSAEDVVSSLEGMDTACDHVDEADLQHSEAQEELAGLRQEAKNIIRDLAATLRVYLSDKDDARKRRIMRRFGYTFVGETAGASEALEAPDDDLDDWDDTLPGRETSTVTVAEKAS